MKRTKRCLVLFSFYDRTGIETYLEKQAEKGWMLDKTSAFGWRFHRIPPQKLHFSVVYFPQTSAYDPGPSESQMEFYDFCEHTGWHLAVSNAQMQIFYSEAENPIPIETDAVLEVAAIHAAAKKSHLSAYYLLAGMGILQAIFFVHGWYTDPISILASNSSLFCAVCWLLIFIQAAAEILGYYTWYKRARTAAELDGSFVRTKEHRTFQFMIMGIMLAAFLLLQLADRETWSIWIFCVMFAGIGGITALTVCILKFMKKRKWPAKINRTVTMFFILVLSFGFAGIVGISVIKKIPGVSSEKFSAETYEYRGQICEIYQDEIPLTVEDLIKTDYDGYSYELISLRHSVLMEQKRAVQRGRWDTPAQPELEYTITEVKLPFLYETCKAALLADFTRNYGLTDPEDDMWKEAVKIDASSWNALEAYQRKLGDDMQMHFLICYTNCIIEIDFRNDWQLTSDQRKLAAEKLLGQAAVKGITGR